MSRDCGSVLLLALVVSAGFCAACDDDSLFAGSMPPMSSGGSGFASGGPFSSPQRVPPIPVPGSADAGAAKPDDPAACLAQSSRIAQDLASLECLGCLCSVAPAATAACDHGCWTLLACIARSGCDAGNTQCILDRCSTPLGGVAELAKSGSLAQVVPFKECSMVCRVVGQDEGEDGGAARPARVACEPPRAEPDTALVGESIGLRWQSGKQPDEYALSVEPWGSVGSFHGAAELDDPGARVFRCDAPGTARISIDSDECIAPVEVVVTCLAPAGTSCCPIEPIGEDALDRCVQLGGSPPCFTGCDCLRNGGVYGAEPDAQGCLQWQLRPSRDSDEHLVCLDEAGDPSPDPRL